MTIDKPLIVTGEQLAAGKGGITSVTLSFNKPLNAAQAVGLANFGYFVYWAGSRADNFTGGGKTTSLEAATYNPASRSLTIVPAAALPLGRFYQIAVDGSTSAPCWATGSPMCPGRYSKGRTASPARPMI